MNASDKKEPYDVIRCIEELVLNSIYTNSTCIALRLNSQTLCIQVVDNGDGLDQLQTLVSESRLFLSKLESNQSNLSIISKISHCSDNLEIITRLKNSDQTYKACFQQSMLPFEVVTVATQRPLSGTTITINNYLSLASSLRKKELNSKTILNEVKNLIECFSVIYPKISFSICDCSANSSVSIAQTKKQYNSKKAANHIMGSGHKLIPFHTSSKHYKIKGLVGENDSNFKRPHLTFINSRFFESVEINKLIDSVFLRLFPELDQYYTIILHIKSSREYYKLSFGWKTRKVSFLFLNELQSLIMKSILDQVSQNILSTKYLMLPEVKNNGNMKHISSTFPDSLDITKSMDYKEDNVIETSHSSKATRNHSTKRQKMEPILNSKSSFIRYSRPFYGKIAYSSEGFCLRSYEETEKKSVSRNCVDVAEEPTFSVEDILHDWMDYSKYESNEDDNSKITSSAKDQSDDAPFCLGTTKDHLPKFINDSKEAIDENYQVAEKIDKEPWVFWETFNRTQSSHSSNGSITTKNLLHNLEKPFFLPLKRFIPKTIDLKKLNTGNEFWSQTNLPLNVTNSTRNSFVIDRRFRQTKQCKLTKSTFENIFVINQVDRKFICCVVEENEKRFLLLIDQHAAHERVCLEKLMRIHSFSDSNGFVQVQPSSIHPFLELTFSTENVEIIKKLKNQLFRYGLELHFDGPMVSFSQIPACFLIRETNELNRRKHSVYKDLVETLLKETIDKFVQYGRVDACLLPTSIRNVLNSLACRGAIKFGDKLSLQQCFQLVKALSQCDVPFQCAHGRPLVAPLMELNDLLPLISTPQFRPKYDRLSE